MGAKIGLIVLFMVLCSSLVLALSETRIEVLSAECDASGNIIAYFKQYERPIDVETINMSSYHRATGQEFELKGDWIYNNEKVRYLTGSLSYPIIAKFVSTNGELTKNGNYTIQIGFFQSASQFSYSKIRFTVDCPGKACFTDMMCEDDEYCNKTNCNYLECDKCHITQFHICDEKCNDKNPCTKDICNKGACVNKYVGGRCCRYNADCNDNLICTTDYCQDNKCYNDPVICKKAEDKCVFATCTEPEGCVYQTDKSCLEKENERRRYLITIGEPEVVKEPFFTRIASWIAGILENFF